MLQQRMIRPLEKAFRFYAVLCTGIFAFQLLGLGMYLVNVWPSARLAGPGGGPIAAGTVAVTGLAMLMGFTRSVAWIAIYWYGSRIFRLLRTEGESPNLGELMKPALGKLTGLMVASCVLDVLFLPAYFASDIFLPFSVSGWRLGVVETARLLFPQVFGVGALIMAYLTHQYGQLLTERGRLKTELDLTI
jgi:hypothetical protein